MGEGETGLTAGERTEKFRREVRTLGGRRLDIALDETALAALNAVSVRRGLPYPRHVFTALLTEEQARLDNVLRSERPALNALNAGLIVRSLLACLPGHEASKQRVLAEFLGPLLRAAIETAHVNGEHLTLLRLLTFVPLSDASVERALALADTADVSVATRRALSLQASAFLGLDERESYYELLEEALETILWNGLLRG